MIFTLREREQIHVLGELDARQLTAREVAEQHALTLRYVRRLLRRYRLQGETSHGEKRPWLACGRKLRSATNLAISSLPEWPGPVRPQS